MNPNDKTLERQYGTNNWKYFGLAKMEIGGGT